MSISFAIIKEEKHPPDKRVVLTPNDCKNFIESFPSAELFVQKSEIRAFSDSEYEALGVKVREDITHADIMLGVKEVPVGSLIPNKSYCFFSHTIKKQPYNRKLLQAILKNNITLYDHEALVDINKNRLIGFGYYAGVVGAYNAIRTVGKKMKTYNIPKAIDLDDRIHMNFVLKKVKLPKIKFVLTGTGRVGRGVKEVLDYMNIRQVSSNQLLNNSFNEPVYAQLDVLDYVKRKDGNISSKKDFFSNPTSYKSFFQDYLKKVDVFIAGHFHNSNAPYFFTRQNLKSKDIKMKIVADISCDIDGPVACTIRSSTIDNPIYGYNPKTESETDFNNPNSIAVMAVDNLPCELPRDSSSNFGEMFLSNIIPAFFNNDKNGILMRSKIAENGKLTSLFSYLQSYVDYK
tara:strand:+ start:622 stop:1830 length:1209 start_codon:yes stop_codon:yes gene_type:complete